MHGVTVGDPVVAGDWFSLTMGIDATWKQGGRMAAEDICVYRVRNGKIDREQFFYRMGSDPASRTQSALHTRAH